jgi:hypothetical protein
VQSASPPPLSLFHCHHNPAPSSADALGPHVGVDSHLASCLARTLARWKPPLPPLSSGFGVLSTPSPLI